jgi:hypothetical protein
MNTDETRKIVMALAVAGGLHQSEALWQQVARRRDDSLARP